MTTIARGCTTRRRGRSWCRRRMRARRRFAAGALVLLALAVGVMFMMNDGPVSFCDIALALDAAVDGGEDAYLAMGEFWDRVSEEMVAGVPDALRGAAETLVAVVESLLAGPRIVAALAFDVLDPPLDAVASACRVG